MTRVVLFGTALQIVQPRLFAEREISLVSKRVLTKALSAHLYKCIISLMK